MSSKIVLQLLTLIFSKDVDEWNKEKYNINVNKATFVGHIYYY